MANTKTSHQVLTANNITDAQILELRALAHSQGDKRTIRVASVALGLDSHLGGYLGEVDARARCAARLNARQGTAHSIDDYGDCMTWCAACQAKALDAAEIGRWQNPETMEWWRLRRDSGAKCVLESMSDRTMNRR
jgi:hypothetical protein